MSYLPFMRSAIKIYRAVIFYSAYNIFLRTVFVYNRKLKETVCIVLDVTIYLFFYLYFQM